MYSISDALGYLTNLDLDQMLRVFWYFIFFDLPRYVVLDFYIFSRVFSQRSQPKRKADFLLKLRDDPPLVSVIIPVLNEDRTIGWTIRSLKEQSYPNMELVIIDDGSTDKTPEICRKLAKQANIAYHRFNERAGKSAVLNYGMKLSKGEFIVFVDSDTTFDRDAVYKLMRAFADPRVGGVSGNLRARNGDTNIWTNLQQIEYLFTISVGRRIKAHLGILPIISGAFGGFRRDIVSIQAVGGHEPGPGNDSDLAIKVRKRGYKIVFEHEATCLTNVPENPLRLIKQRSRWDRNLIKNRIHKHRNVYNPFSKNFRFLDMLSFVDSIFFHVILAAVTVIYLFDVAVNFTSFLPVILALNFCLYLAAEVLELCIAAVLNKRTEDLALMGYLLLFNPYKLFMKLVRLTAY
ncbi:glycosyltransferase, partial [bacterium]|nr:glycosyltransferase [bacterium]